MDAASTAQFDKLYQYAVVENDPVLYAMVQAFRYNPENWKCWGDFLVDVIFALSAVNKASQEHLMEVLSKQPPAPYVVPIANFVPDGAWSSDYK